MGAGSDRLKGKSPKADFENGPDFDYPDASSGRRTPSDLHRVSVLTSRQTARCGGSAFPTGIISPHVLLLFSRVATRCYRDFHSHAARPRPRFNLHQFNAGREPIVQSASFHNSPLPNAAPHAQREPALRVALEEEIHVPGADGLAIHPPSAVPHGRRNFAELRGLRQWNDPFVAGHRWRREGL